MEEKDSGCEEIDASLNIKCIFMMMFDAKLLIVGRYTYTASFIVVFEDLKLEICNRELERLCFRVLGV